MTDRSDSTVTAVSDTARWVAHHRAIESRRPDALFHDPFAELLAGERGQAIAGVATADAAVAAGDSWYLTVRTALIDSAVHQAISDGYRRVINLGAGLDARPYRMNLPADLTWIEVDDAALLTEKSEILASAPPHCPVSRRALDVTDSPALAALVAEEDPAHTLVLAEGLIMYLTPEQADSVMDTLRAAGVGRWSLDFSSAGVGALMTNRNQGLLQRAPWRFLPTDGLAHFERHGWTPITEDAVQPLFPAAVRLGRLTTEQARTAAAGPQPDPRAPGDTPFSAVVTLRPALGATDN